LMWSRLFLNFHHTKDWLGRTEKNLQKLRMVQ
jgi:hypothetical protein